jgi:hypothetical protein
MRTGAVVGLACLAAGCGGGDKVPLAPPILDAGLAPVPPAIFSADTAVTSPDWYPPEHAEADPEPWIVSEARDTDGGPSMHVAIGADGSVFIAHDFSDSFEYGENVRVVRYSHAKGWIVNADVFKPGTDPSYGSTGLAGIEVLDSGEALVVWYRNPAEVRERLYYASHYRQNGGWSSPQRLGSGHGHALVRAADERVHVMICGSRWQSWSFGAEEGLVRTDALSFAPPATGGRQSGPCGVDMRDGAALGYDLRIKGGELFGSFKDAPLTFVDADGQGVVVGTTSHIPVLAHGDGWTALLTLTASFERQVDGSWAEAGPLLDAKPFAWLPALGMALFVYNEDERLMLQREADGWKGPFRVQSHLDARLLSHSNGDVAVYWSEYVSGSMPAVYEVFVQRRVAGTWYAAEMVGSAKHPADAAASQAGDLVLVLVARDGSITLHAKGPHFR